MADGETATGARPPEEPSHRTELFLFYGERIAGGPVRRKKRGARSGRKTPRADRTRGDAEAGRSDGGGDEAPLEFGELVEYAASRLPGIVRKRIRKYVDAFERTGEYRTPVETRKAMFVAYDRAEKRLPSLMGPEDLSRYAEYRDVVRGLMEDAFRSLT